MTCSSNTAEPCIHTPNCHHFRPDNAQASAAAPTKKLASVVINVFEGRICEILIRGDEKELREVIQENISRLTSLLAA